MPAQYATVTEFKSLALPPDAVEELTDADIDAQLQASAGMIDAYLGAKYTLPLTAPFPQALVRCNVDMAAFHVLLRHGFDPESYDANYKEMHDRCVDFLEQVRDGKLTIPGIIDDTPETVEGQARVATATARGWY